METEMILILRRILTADANSIDTHISDALWERIRKILRKKGALPKSYEDFPDEKTKDTKTNVISGNRKSMDVLAPKTHCKKTMQRSK